MKYEKTKDNLKKNTIYVFYALIVVVFFACVFHYHVDVPKIDGVDDQRSTLWPLLISLIITMLGSLITTYVFLKEALDRTIDEKPYYQKVVKAYREETMNFLWDYSVCCLFLILMVVLVYGLFYFGSGRTPDWFRAVLCFFYMVCIVFSGRLLYICIHIDEGIHKVAERSRKHLEEAVKQQREQTEGKVNIKFLRQFVRRFSEDYTLEKWLQIEEASSGRREHFVHCFSEWEKVLLLLVDRTKGFISEQSMGQNIRVLLEQGEKLLGIYAEENDAKSNGWDGAVYHDLKAMQDALDMNWKFFSQYYDILSEYRDLLQVQKETRQDKHGESGEAVYLSIGKRDDGITQMFAEFVLQLSLRYLKMIPKIELFFPAGKFQYADFYNVRIENSSFRSSLFEHVILARVKMQNANLGMSRFEQVEFYSADIRDCSWNNCLFRECGLDASIWSNADLTGTEFENVHIKDATFENTILSNIVFRESWIENTLLEDSKIWDMELVHVQGNSLHSCSFSKSDLKNIRILVEDVPVAEMDTEIFDHSKLLYFDKLYYTKETGIQAVLTEKWFTFSDNPFRHLRVSRNADGRNQYEEWAVWKQIQKLSFFDMTETVFSNAKLEGIPFYRMDFSQSVFLHTKVKDGIFVASNLAGCVMERVVLRGARLRGVYMGSTVLTDGILFGTDCSLVNFQDSDLTSLHASEAKLEYCTFERSDCSRIDLTKAVVRCSSFRDGILNEAELTSSEFADVLLDNCIAGSMLSSYTRFYRCTFRNAFLKLSSFNYTIFRECGFQLADFSESTVMGAEFCGCDFSEANFRNTIFIEVTFRDNENMKEEIFEGCTFMDTVFEGRDQKWEKIFRKNTTMKMRYSNQEQEECSTQESRWIHLKRLFGR